MRNFLIHVVLTLAAAVLMHGSLKEVVNGMGEFGIYFAVFFLLWLSSYLYYRSYFRQFYRFALLGGYFLKELWINNLEIIYYVITPDLQFRPGILRYELRLRSDTSISLLANLITLTPGTLSLEVSSDKKYLYFHTINIPGGDLEAARQKIRNGFEERILAILE